CLGSGRSSCWVCIGRSRREGRRVIVDGPREDDCTTPPRRRQTAPQPSFGGVKSAIHSCAGCRPSRVEVHITRLPSGLKTGSTSCPGAYVMRTFLPPSTSIQYRS